MSNNTTLEINLNEEYKIKIEKGKDFNQSIFNEVYNSALKNVIEIVVQSDEKTESPYDDYNNLIAFTGERGKGKSSSMISFRDALVNKECKNHISFFKSSEYEYLKNKSFATIDIIDPSLFRGEESLFEIILAKMFQEFQTKISNNDFKLGQDSKRDLIKNFQNVFENLQIINSDRKDLYKKESIEALSRLATSSNLRDCFKRLVNSYLVNFENNKDFLIIPIDDFDLSIAGAYNMLEDIRQFLILPNVIILVSCKMEQLNDSILNYLTNEYRNLTSFYNTQKQFNISSELENTRSQKIAQSISTNIQGGLSDKLKLSSGKYLEKLFPIHRRLVLPELYVNNRELRIYVGNTSDLDSNSLEDVVKKENCHDIKIKLIENKLLYVGNNLPLLLSDIIYSKAKLFINFPKYRNNVIYPENLRGVLNFLSVFKKSDLNSELIRYVIEVAKNNLNTEFSEIFNILEKQTLQTLNIALVNCISNLKGKFSELNINYILYASNPSNVNIGDVYTVFKNLENQINYTNQEQIIFIDLLNIYYSLRLIELENGDVNNQSLYISNSLQIFKTSSTRRRRRDFVTFEGLSIKNLFDKIKLTDDKLWFVNFFPVFGKYFNNYRDELYSPFFKPLHNVSNGVFSPLAIFNNILFPEQFTRNLNIPNPETSSLYTDILEWNLNDVNLNLLFKNSMFFTELLDQFDKETRTEHKSEGMVKTDDGEEIYFDILYDYFISSLEKALVTISNKYPFLNINAKNWIENHPILKYWKNICLDEDRRKLFINLFQEIYSSQDKKAFTKEEMDISKRLLKEYSNYFDNDQSNNSRGAKQAMNSVYKAFGEDSELYLKLKEFRDLMNTDLKDGLDEIEKLLKSIR
ncbi:hypothetical protein [Flavobacterium sp. C3NV]|uniref:hypothetical protein n=1 Tax=Flavobacterium sp. C3NV TaxID=3393358 RepID=UPI0039900061